MIDIVPVNIKPDFEVINQLAQVIWWEHYTPIIGKLQVDYMLKKF